MADTLLEEIKKIKSMETPIVDKGFKPASVYKGKTLMDTYEAFENKTGMSAIDYLMKKNCKKIILGCTELPIAIFAFKSFKTIKSSKIFLDPNLILANATMKKYKS